MQSLPSAKTLSHSLSTRSYQKKNSSKGRSALLSLTIHKPGTEAPVVLCGQRSRRACTTRSYS
eukprot:scaffold72307_cov51-Attheya_sp.AAC.3